MTLATVFKKLSGVSVRFVLPGGVGGALAPLFGRGSTAGMSAPTPVSADGVATDSAFAVWPELDARFGLCRREDLVAIVASHSCYSCAAGPR
jgi:hypothetical protein